MSLSPIFQALLAAVQEFCRTIWPGKLAQGLQGCIVATGTLRSIFWYEGAGKVACCSVGQTKQGQV